MIAQRLRYFLVLEIDQRLAGFASYDQFRGIGYAHDGTHHHPAAEASGAGRALMRALMDHVRARTFIRFGLASALKIPGVAFHSA
jgi:L-amino acid N-acyltransferase YncA